MMLSWYQGSPLPHQQPEVIACSLDQILTPLSECWQRNSWFIEPAHVFQSSVVQFQWVAVNCSFTFPLFADKSRFTEVSTVVVSIVNVLCFQKMWILRIAVGNQDTHLLSLIMILHWPNSTVFTSRTSSHLLFNNAMKEIKNNMTLFFIIGTIFWHKENSIYLFLALIHGYQGYSNTETASIIMQHDVVLSSSCQVIQFCEWYNIGAFEIWIISYWTEHKEKGWSCVWPWLHTSTTLSVL